jgi:hypothetical protein
MKILFIIVFMVFVPYSAYAACSWVGNVATSADATYNEVDTCVSEASSKTGNVTIEIPDDTTTWSNTLTVDMSSGWANLTGLTIRGQNDCTTTNNASPDFDYPTSCGTNITNFKLNYTGKEGKSFRLSNMEFEGTSGVVIEGDGKSWRFDNLFWNNVTGKTSNRVVWIQKNAATELTEGVFDHNYFYSWTFSAVFHVQSTIDGGNYEWMTGAQLGTSHNIYIENNKFDGDNAAGNYITDNNGASKWVIRHNHITEAYIAGHDAQVSNMRGSLSTEVYGNTFVVDGQCYIIYRSGATGVFYDNTITGTLGCGTSIAFAIYRLDGGGGWGLPCSNSSGTYYLATSDNYPQSCVGGDGCIDVDGSASSPNGYPCRDQVGVSGNDPQVGGGSPWLFWNNTINGSDAGSSIGVASYGSSHITENIDWCSHATTMPSSCNGVETTYTPYTYPHPLRDEGTNPSASGITFSGVTIGQ